MQQRLCATFLASDDASSGIVTTRPLSRCGAFVYPLPEQECEAAGSETPPQLPVSASAERFLCGRRAKARRARGNNRSPESGWWSRVLLLYVGALDHVSRGTGCRASFVHSRLPLTTGYPVCSRGCSVGSRLGGNITRRPKASFMQISGFLGRSREGLMNLLAMAQMASSGEQDSSSRLEGIYSTLFTKRVPSLWPRLEWDIASGVHSDHGFLVKSKVSRPSPLLD